MKKIGVIFIVVASFSCHAQDAYDYAYKDCMESFSKNDQLKSYIEKTTGKDLEQECKERAESHAAWERNGKPILTITKNYCIYLGHRHETVDECLSGSYKMDYESVVLQVSNQVSTAVVVKAIDTLKAAGTKEVLLSSE